VVLLAIAWEHRSRELSVPAGQQRCLRRTVACLVRMRLSLATACYRGRRCKAAALAASSVRPRKESYAARFPLVDWGDTRRGTVGANRARKTCPYSRCVSASIDPYALALHIRCQSVIDLFLPAEPADETAFADELAVGRANVLAWLRFPRHSADVDARRQTRQTHTKTQDGQMPDMRESAACLS
jgi:hypothetical protein